MKHQLEDGMYCRVDGPGLVALITTIGISQDVMVTAPFAALSYNNYNAVYGSELDVIRIQSHIVVKKGKEVPTTEFINRLKGEHKQ